MCSLPRVDDHAILIYYDANLRLREATLNNLVTEIVSASPNFAAA